MNHLKNICITAALAALLAAPLVRSEEPQTLPEITVTGKQEGRDTHEFYGMLKRLSIRRLQALSAVGPDLTTPVACSRFWRLLQVVRDAEVPIMIFVTSPGVVQIHIARSRTSGSRRRGATCSMRASTLPVRGTTIADRFVVRKPTTDGIVTSLEVFDDEDLIVQMFG